MFHISSLQPIIYSIQCYGQLPLKPDTSTYQCCFCQTLLCQSPQYSSPWSTSQCRQQVGMQLDAVVTSTTDFLQQIFPDNVDNLKEHSMHHLLPSIVIPRFPLAKMCITYDLPLELNSNYISRLSSIITHTGGSRCVGRVSVASVTWCVCMCVSML